MTGPLDFIVHIREESRRFADCLRDADPTTPVPTCPDWSASDLVWHLTEVQAFWTTIVAERLAAPSAAIEAEPARPPGHDDLLDLFDHTTTRLVTTLADTPSEVPVWTWAPDRTAGFVRRRQAHEALIHRRDAEWVSESFGPVDPALAADGVDEAVRLMFASGSDGFVADGSLTRIDLADGYASWDLAFGSEPDGTDGYTVITAAEHAADARLVATAADLDLWLWSRGDEAPTVEGDRALFDRFAGIVAAGIS